MISTALSLIEILPTKKMGRKVSKVEYTSHESLLVFCLLSVVKIFIISSRPNISFRLFTANIFCVNKKRGKTKNNKLKSYKVT